MLTSAVNGEVGWFVLAEIAISVCVGVRVGVLVANKFRNRYVQIFTDRKYRGDESRGRV